MEERIEWQTQDVGEDIAANEHIQRLPPEPANLTKGENQTEYFKVENDMNTAPSETGESQEKKEYVGRASNIVFRQIQEPIPGCRIPSLFRAKMAPE
ncbi:hypothetical protein ACFLYC_02265 [Chloroflexota bacterium]